jgi:hypothetical protein
MDVFLRTARITKKTNIGTGATNSIRARLSDGQILHDAQIQIVDIEKLTFSAGRASEMNFKDSYRYNIGGYRLARLLGMQNVPMSVSGTSRWNCSRNAAASNGRCSARARSSAAAAARARTVSRRSTDPPSRKASYSPALT